MIYKVDEVNGKKRFNVTMRKSLVVYGVSAVEREALSEGSEIEVTIAA